MKSPRALVLFAVSLFLVGNVCKAFDGAEIAEFYGYQNCVVLHNKSTRVVICPDAGGRVLEYSLNGKNVLYLPEGDEGWVWDGSDVRGNMWAGRFDIGPEQVVPKRPLLWQGKWAGVITGDRSAVLRSQADASTGVRLERSFELDADSSKLICTQTIINTSGKPVEYCHWSRTFAVGHGKCVVPLSKPQRFMKGYVRYDPPGRMLNMNPSDDHVTQDGQYLVISDHPKYPKLGFDSHAGWLAYYAPNDLMFVKKFPTFPERAYNEVAGLTISVWYPERDMVELEPIGPRERLEKVGDRASFRETWFLVDQDFPESKVNPSATAEAVEKLDGPIGIVEPARDDQSDSPGL